MSIAITDEQFLEAFQKTCRAFFDEYKQQEDPDDVIGLFWGRSLTEDLVERMPEEYRALGESACREVRGFGGKETERDRFWAMEKIENSFQTEMYEWFAVAGYDDEHIPPAPEVDYTRRRMKKEEIEIWKGKIDADWYRGANVKSAYQVGQLIYTGSSDQSKGWADLYLLSGSRLCHFYPQTSGVGVWGRDVTELVYKTAESYSRLTDWSQFTMDLPKKVRRSITRKMNTIIDENGLRNFARLG